MGSVSWRKRGNRYLVSWRLDDGSQGGKTVDTPDEARDLAAEKRLEMRRGTWRERRSGRISFRQWADDWWGVWAADRDRSPTALAATENRLRRHVRPWFDDRAIERIGPADIRRWQAQLAAMVGRESLLACRSILHRILQFAEDEGAIPGNPVRKVPAPKRRADPSSCSGRPSAAPTRPKRLVDCSAACRCPGGITSSSSWALACGSVSWPACAVAGSTSTDRCPSFRSSRCATRPAASSGALQGPPQERRRHPGATACPAAGRVHPPAAPTRPRPRGPRLTGPGGGNGVPAGSRTMLSRYNFRRVYQRAVARAGHDLAAVDPHGPHDLRHTFSTWLEDAGIPARVIDELMGHERSRRGELEGGSRIGARYRHTTPETAVRVAAAIQERLVVVVQIAEAVLELDDSGGRVF
jgi:Phage integrase family/Phage integrase, N-terminal SAM-like domain